MRVTLESTTRFITVNGVKARVWEGITEKGVRCYAAIALVAAHSEDDNKEFEQSLMEHKPPSSSAIKAFDIRTVL